MLISDRCGHSEDLIPARAVHEIKSKDGRSDAIWRCANYGYLDGCIVRDTSITRNEWGDSHYVGLAVECDLHVLILHSSCVVVIDYLVVDHLVGVCASGRRDSERIERYLQFKAVPLEANVGEVERARFERHGWEI